MNTWVTLICIAAILSCLYKGIAELYSEYDIADEWKDIDPKEGGLWLLFALILTVGCFIAQEPGERVEPMENPGTVELHKQASPEPTKEELEVEAEKKVHPRLKEVQQPVDSEAMFEAALERAKENEK